MKKVIYPGSFDPMTNGHVDIINRTLSTFDEVVVAVIKNHEKSPTFSLDERMGFIKGAFFHEPRVTVEVFSGLLVDFAGLHNTNVVVRGLRATSDFEYEFQLAAMNRKLNPQFETVFLMTSSDTYFLSSRLIRDIAFLGGDVSKMVPAHVNEALKAQAKEKQC